MIKNGVFTVYQGKEYVLSRGNKNGQVYFRIRSNNSEDMNLGFRLSTNGNLDCFVKDIIPSEVNEVYGINTFGIYKGCEVGVRMEDKTGQNVLLGVGDEMLASKLDFEFDERGVYMKWVPKEEVELFEKKEPLPNYFK